MPNGKTNKKRATAQAVTLLYMHTQQENDPAGCSLLFFLLFIFLFFLLIFFLTFLFYVFCLTCLFLAFFLLVFLFVLFLTHAVSP